MLGEALNSKLTQHQSKRRKVESDWSTFLFVSVDSRASDALVISGDGLFKCRTVTGVVHEEAFNLKWFEEAVTPIDQYVQKGATFI